MLNKGSFVDLELFFTGTKSEIWPKKVDVPKVSLVMDIEYHKSRLLQDPHSFKHEME